MENSKPVILETPMADSIMQDPLNSLEGVTSPPSYADILKKKLVESSGSSGEDEHFTKEVGSKSRKEIREEEVKRLKM